MAVLTEDSGELAGGGAYAGSLFTQAKAIDAALLQEKCADQWRVSKSLRVKSKSLTCY